MQFSHKIRKNVIFDLQAFMHVSGTLQCMSNRHPGHVPVHCQTTMQTLSANRMIFIQNHTKFPNSQNHAFSSLHAFIITKLTCIHILHSKFLWIASLFTHWVNAAVTHGLIDNSGAFSLCYSPSNNPCLLPNYPSLFCTICAFTRLLGFLNKYKSLNLSKVALSSGLVAMSLRLILVSMCPKIRKHATASLIL